MPDAPKRPNILLITSDQQHYDTLGFKNPKIKTPALDRLAREGTNFTRAYCPNPTCTPTRASIITGMYPSCHGAWTLGTKLPETVPTVGEALHRAGYRTSLIGKAHFQPLATAPGSESLECQPTLRDLDFWRTFNDTHTPWYGFDHCELARMHSDESHVGQHYAIWMEQKGLRDWDQYFRPLPGRPESDVSKAPKMLTGPEYGWRDPDHPWELPDELHHSTWIGERTVAEIERCAASGEPFFCWSSYFDPHPPYCIPEPWHTMYDPADMEIGEFIEGEFDDMPPFHRATREPDSEVWKRWKTDDPPIVHGGGTHVHDKELLRKSMAVYYGMISLMDREIGRTLDALDRLTGSDGRPLSENTVVVFTTDHGHFLGQHGLIAKGPYHYEDEIRLPFIAKAPGRIEAGAESDAMVSLVDLAPTFLGYAGIEVPGRMQGVSQVEAWSSPREADGGVRDHIIVENRHTHTQVHLRTLVTDRYKLTLYRGRDWGELFDLRDDPEEMTNLYHDPAYAELRAELTHKFMMAEMEREPTWMPRITGA